MEESIVWLTKFAARLSSNYNESYSYEDLMQDLDNVIQQNRQTRGLVSRIGEDGETFAVNNLKTMWKHYRIVRS